MIRVPGNDILAGTRGHGRRRSDRCAESLHDRTPVGLLLITYLYHIDRTVNAELLRRIAERTAPLTGTGFRRQIGNSLFLRIIGLCDSGIQFMAAGGRNRFILEIDMGRSPKGLFQFVGSHERSAPVGSILLADRFGDRNPFVRLVEFLVGTGLTEDGIEVFRFKGLMGCRIQERKRLVGHNRLDVEEMGRDFALRKQVLFLSHGVYLLSV